MSSVSVSITPSPVDESVMVHSIGIASPNIGLQDTNLWFHMKRLVYQQKLETWSIVTSHFGRCSLCNR